MSLMQVPKTRSAHRWALLCCMLVLLAAPLQAQFTYQDLYDFNCQTGGCDPQNVGALVQVGGEILTGATKDSVGGVGTLFNVSTSPPVGYGDFFDFANSYGTNPGGAVVFDTYGNLYATTGGGGAYGNGTLFVMVGGIGGLPVDLHDFTNAEGFPVAPPVLGKDGNLYGFSSFGAAYTVTITSTFINYNSLGTNAPGQVYSPLWLASDGYLYGTSDNGGKNNLGTVFRMTTPSGAIKVIFNFNGKNGEYLYSPLVEVAPLTFYGTTSEGGKNGAGVIFKVTSKGAYTKLFDFAGGCSGTGASPSAGLTLGTDGNLYGVTVNGGTNCVGAIFQVSTTGNFSKLIDFSGSGGAAPGANPYAGLALNTNGKFYGLTTNGGANNNGVYFVLAPLNLRQLLTVEGPIFVPPGIPVQILGNDLTQTYQLTFGGVQAQFQAQSDTLMSATVPMDAVDGLVVDTFQSGLQIQTLSAMHILPLITNLDPPSGPVGTQVGIVGGGFAGATKVTFGGVKATNFTIVTPSLIQAIVPSGARTGKVVVTTPNGTAKSPENFTVN